MALFQKPFFSIAGQKERLANVVGVLKAPFTGGSVKANTSSKAVNAVLATVANHPLATATVVGTVANIPKAVALYKNSQVVKANPAAAKTAGVIQKTVSASKSSSTRPGLIQAAKDRAKKAIAFGSQTAPGVIKTVSQRSVSEGTPNAGLILPPQSSPVKASSGVITKQSSTTSPKRRRKARKPRSARKSSRRRSKSPRRRKKHYGTAKQYARKGGKKVHYAKNGTPYIILANGRARFVKGKKRKHR